MNMQVLAALIVAPLFVAAFAGVGGRILEFAGLAGKPSAFRRLPIAVALGFGVYSYLGYLLVWFVPLPALLILGLMVAGTLVGRRYLRDLSANFSELVGSLFRNRISPSFVVMAAISTGMLGLAALNALVPTRHGDALSGYMLTAKFIAAQGLGYMPYNPRYSLFPLGTEIVFSYSFPFGTELIAQFVDYFLGILLIAGIYEFANRYARPLYSFMAAIGFLLTEEVLYNWANGKVDIAATFTMLMGWSLLFLVSESANPRAIALSAFLIGTACNQKYTNWVFAPTFPVAVLLVKANWRRAVQPALLGVAIIGACMLPHFIRNTMYTGNPIAPLGRNIIPTTNVYLAHGDPVSAQYLVKRFQFLDVNALLQLPANMFLARDGEGWSRTALFPWLLFVGLLGCLFVFRSAREVRGVLIFGLFQLAIWLILAPHRALPMHARYLLPVTALLTAPAALGLQAFASRKLVLRAGLVTAFTFFFFLQGVWGIRSWRQHWRFVAGVQTEEQWQQIAQPDKGFTILHKLAPSLGPDRKLMIGANLYNLPFEKILFASTEEQFSRFRVVADTEKVALLRREHYRYYYHKHVFTTGSKYLEMPDWCKGLPVLDHVPGEQGYTVFEIPPEGNAENTLSMQTIAASNEQRASQN